jgi:hypothetical protein
MRLATTCAVLVAMGRPAEPCTGDGSPRALEAAAPDFFTWYEQARYVAEVEVTAAPGFTNEGHGLRGKVELAIGKPYKGTPPKTLSFVQEPTACGGMQKGKLVGFFGDAGKPIGFVGVDVIPALAAWSTALASARPALLQQLAKDKQPSIAGAAKKRLAGWDAADPSWKPPGTSTTAIARVRSVWASIVAAAPSRMADFDDALAKGRTTLRASKLACHAAANRVRDAVGTNVSPIVGSSAALGDGDCWLVAASVGFYELEAYLGASDGKLRLVWIPPEG